MSLILCHVMHVVLSRISHLFLTESPLLLYDYETKYIGPNRGRKEAGRSVALFICLDIKVEY